MKVVIDYGNRKEFVSFESEWAARIYMEQLAERISRSGVNVRVYIEAPDTTIHDLGCTVFTGD